MRPRNRACDAREGCREGLGAPAGAATRLEGYRRVLCPHNDFVKKGFGDPAAIHPPTGFFRKATRCGSSLDSTDSMVHGSQHDSTTRDVNRRVLFWVQNSSSEQFRAVAFGRHFKHRSDREGVPDSDRDLRPCVIVARAARRRDRRTLSLEPRDATHGPPVASRETVVSRDLTLTETHQDKDGTQPWESRA